jgi:RimJ/RimL family protein N-acetyltransferase
MSEGSGPYRVMPRPALSDGALTIRAVEPADIEAIRQWRNAQLDVLRQSAPISRADQIAYYARSIWPDKSVCRPRNLLLTYLLEDRPIGYGGLVHLNWEHRRGELSFLLDPEIETDLDRRTRLWSAFIALIKEFAFVDIGLNRISTETYAFRARHIETLEDGGFKPEGRLREQVWIDGEPVDSLVHGCLAREFGGARS